MPDCRLTIEVITEKSIRARLQEEVDARECSCEPDHNACSIVTSLSECLDAGHPRTDAWFTLFGKNLGTHLFQDALSDVMVEALQATKNTNGRVRMFLSFGKEASNLAKLPWEFAQYRSQCLGVRADLTLARFQQTKRLTPLASRNFRVLLIEGGLNLGADDLAEQLSKFHDPKTNAKLAITRWNARQYFESKTSPRTEDNTFDVIHFIGHGVRHGNSTALLFELDSDSQRTEPVDAFGLFAAGRATVVVLQACNSGKSETITLPPGDVLAKGIPAVIAMQYPILASHGTTFSSTLYSQLISRSCVDVAVQCARDALYSMRTTWGPTFGIPVLYLATTEPIAIEPISDLKNSPTSQSDERKIERIETDHVVVDHGGNKFLIPLSEPLSTVDSLTVNDLRAQLAGGNDE